MERYQKKISKILKDLRYIINYAKCLVTKFTRLYASSLNQNPQGIGKNFTTENDYNEVSSKIKSIEKFAEVIESVRNINRNLKLERNKQGQSLIIF